MPGDTPTDSDRRYVMAAGDQSAASRKPTLRQLGVDPADLDWQRSGSGAGSLEVAFVGGSAMAGGGALARDGASAGDGVLRAGGGADWVLLGVRRRPGRPSAGLRPSRVDVLPRRRRAR